MNKAEGKPFAIHQKQESRLARILVNHIRILYIGAIYRSLKKEYCNFYQTRSHAAVLYDTLPAEFIEKVICMKTKEQLYQREKRKTTCCSQSKFAMWITRSTQARSKIILVNTKRCTELPGNWMQHCGSQSSRHIPHNSSTAE